jgi:hypothetical protein
MFNKILYINSPQNDFLSDSFLIGLKQLYGHKVTEWPVNNYIYKKGGSAAHVKIHGMGFTLSNILDNALSVSYDEAIPFTEFDLFIFGDIYRQSVYYKKLSPFLTKKNTLILDGEDTPAIYPYYFAPWKKPYSFFFPKLHKKHIYFKREIIAKKTNYYTHYKMIPKFLSEKLVLPKNLLPISFSIPQEKIVTDLPPKTKLFGKHIVDEAIASKVEGAMTKYAFDNEADYYNDLQQSKFGITTKRGGWDCLRHYEIAANGAVICFKNLCQKPDTCAPHDLVPNHNCIEYFDYDDLMNQINLLTDEDYHRLQLNSLKWVHTKTCTAIVEKCLQQFIKRV